jgi:hypothetical protein
MLVMLFTFLDIFLIGSLSCLCPPVLDFDPIYASYVARMTGAHYHIRLLLVEMESQ